MYNLTKKQLKLLSIISKDIVMRISEYGSEYVDKDSNIILKDLSNCTDDIRIEFETLNKKITNLELKLNIKENKNCK